MMGWWWCRRCPGWIKVIIKGWFVRRGFWGYLLCYCGVRLFAGITTWHWRGLFWFNFTVKGFAVEFRYRNECHKGSLGRQFAYISRHCYTYSHPYCLYCLIPIYLLNTWSIPLTPKSSGIMSPAPGHIHYHFIDNLSISFVSQSRRLNPSFW